MAKRFSINRRLTVGTTQQTISLRTGLSNLVRDTSQPIGLLSDLK